ncbi:MAG: hypothetical protein LBC53_10260 [Spirochaetaceae bacterium]|nr:hypothetical protein [Spirochaetaceae bacterium]
MIIKNNSIKLPAFRAVSALILLKTTPSKEDKIIKTGCNFKKTPVKTPFAGLRLYK